MNKERELIMELSDGEKDEVTGGTCYCTCDDGYHLGDSGQLAICRDFCYRNNHGDGHCL